MAAMDGREHRLLNALVGMVHQYLGDGEMVDTQSMAAGEDAIAVLSEYGLMEIVPPGHRYGRWTKAGNDFWKSN